MTILMRLLFLAAIVAVMVGGLGALTLFWFVWKVMGFTVAIVATASLAMAIMATVNILGRVVAVGRATINATADAGRTIVVNAAKCATPMPPQGEAVVQ